MFTLAALAVLTPASAAGATSGATGHAAAAFGAREAGASHGGQIQIMQLLKKLGGSADPLSLVGSSSADRLRGRKRSNAIALYDTNVLLDQVKRAAESTVSGQRLDPTSTEILVSITDTLLQTVLPDIFEQHNDSQRAINMSADAIGTCSDTLDGHLSTLPSINSTVDANRETHLQCRAQHMDANMVAEEASTGLEEFMASLAPPEQGCNVVSVSKNSSVLDLLHSSDVEQWLESLIDWGTNNLAMLDASVQDCESAVHNLSHTCDKYQMQFESVFCQYRQMLTTWCQDYTTCYDASVRSFNQTVEDQNLTVAHLKIEYEALQKIICYLGVLTNNFTSVEGQTAQLDHCQQLVVDTSMLDLWIPALPPPDDCPSGPVSVYPGHELWIPTEYEGMEHIVAPVLACEHNLSMNSSSGAASLIAISSDLG